MERRRVVLVSCLVAGTGGSPELVMNGGGLGWSSVSAWSRLKTDKERGWSDLENGVFGLLELFRIPEWLQPEN
ncbi:hypothetical protein KY290_005160 [Solanum tuberosum]|uniref:Uncharacterized protein n=1 Tax=Solanum tuberosum TaxID=4113 RepID=A0ABQ7WDC2_SOLTU|nr:hypothetical protein KY289_005555 [Solanum tuberosum]KAH0751895.1 hypothetical protein KY285_005043 [Solanum tuberosum]KAH0778733.1 hypothetical protein KY290_005160 [Solanum tuberosum]